MSEFITIDAKELNQLIKDVAALPEEAIKEIEPSTVESAEIIKNKTKSNLLKHNKTGELSESLKINKPSKRRKYKYQIYSKVYYGKGGAHGTPIELGHSIRFEKGGRIYGVVKEYPVLRPAAEDSKNQSIDNTIKAMNKALDKFGKGL